MKKFLSVLPIAALLSTSAFAEESWLNRYSDESYVIHVQVTIAGKARHGFYSGNVFGDAAACKTFLANGDSMDEGWPVAKLQLRNYAEEHNAELSPFECVSIPEAKRLEAKNYADAATYQQAVAVAETPEAPAVSGPVGPDGADRPHAGALLQIVGRFTNKIGEHSATFQGKLFKSEEACKAFMDSEEFTQAAQMFVKAALQNGALTDKYIGFKCEPAKGGQSI